MRSRWAVHVPGIVHAKHRLGDTVAAGAAVRELRERVRLRVLPGQRLLSKWTWLPCRNIHCAVAPVPNATKHREGS